LQNGFEEATTTPSDTRIAVKGTPEPSGVTIVVVYNIVAGDIE